MGSSGGGGGVDIVGMVWVCLVRKQGCHLFDVRFYLMRLFNFLIVSSNVYNLILGQGQTGRGRGVGGRFQRVPPLKGYTPLKTPTLTC